MNQKLNKSTQFLLTILLLAHAFLINGQENSDDKMYQLAQFPPSPEASAMARFDEYPVNKSTGLPDISIPLFTIEEGGVTIPIVLRYHAGGLRVQEEPTTVGLGWSLSYGGNISRSVRGLPDETGNGFLKNSAGVPSFQAIWNSYNNLDLINHTRVLMNQLTQKKREYEPDLFSYSFGNQSGSFMFGNDLNIYTIPYDGTQIRPIFGSADEYQINGFIAHDDNGIEYKFGNIGNANNCVETTDVPNWSDVIQNLYVSAWLLKHIYNPFTNTQSTFYYTDNYTSSIPIETESKTYSLTPGGWGDGVQSNDITHTNHNGKLIDRIVVNGKVVTFTYENWAFNEEPRNKLSMIEYTNEFDEDFITVVFKYGSYNDTRLRLDTVTISTNESTDKKRFYFEYNSSDIPHVNSKAIDHFGYYNGAHSNTSLLPSFQLGNQMIGNNANRNPNPEYTGKGTLKKINYPTGGYTEYLFEQNNYQAETTINEISLDSTIVTLSVEDLTDTDSLNLNQAFADIIENQNIVPALYKLEATLVPSCVTIWPEQCMEEESGSIIIYNIDSNSEVARIDLTNNESNLSKELVFTSMDLNNANYTMIVVKTLPLTGTSITANFELSYYEISELTQSVMKEGGGQRLKEMIHYDPVSDMTNRRTFEYSGYPTSSEKLNYISLSKRKQTDGYGCGAPILNATVSSSAVRGLGSSANTVAYSKVREYHGTKDDHMGYIDTYFKKATDDHTGGGPPFFSRNSYQWIRSLVLDEVLINSIEDTIKSTHYDYELIPDMDYSIRTFKASRKHSLDCITLNHQELRDEFIYNNYDYNIGNYRISKTTSIDYVYQNNERNKVVKENYMYYDDPMIHKPTKIETNDSQRNIITEESFYPTFSVLNDCYSPCMQNYKVKNDSCNNLDNIAWEELSDCSPYFGKYFDKYWECASKETKREKNNCFRQNKDSLDTWIGQYHACLDNLSLDYLNCYSRNFSFYSNCIAEMNDCIEQKYESETTPKLKGSFWMVLNGITSKPIEKIEIQNGVSKNHHKWNYHLHQTNSSDTIALLHSIDKYINGTMNMREVEVTAYDDQNNIAELKYKAQDQYKSFKWGNHKSYPLVGVENAQVHEIFYEGFENENGIVFQENTFSRTGKRASQGGHYTIPASFLTPPADSRMSYWYFMDGKWNFYEGPFERQINSQGTQIDEIRVYPSMALVTTYAYDGFGKLISSTDPNNITTYYEYDGLGRLTIIRDDDLNILKTFEYNFASPE